MFPIVMTHFELKLGGVSEMIRDGTLDGKQVR